MKTTYTTPTAFLAGDAVRETKGGSAPPPDQTGAEITVAAGAVGFNL